MDRVTGPLSKRAVLRTGYGAIIAVLVFAAWQAYRIQSNVSEQSLGIYHKYVDQDAALATLRRNVWLAGTDVRDFFIETTPAHAALLEEQIKSLDQKNLTALAHLDKISSKRSVVADIRKNMEEFWEVIRPLPRTMLNEPNNRRYAFLQREIVPRRGDLYNSLLSLQAADRQRLEESEKEFAVARRNAAKRLMLILALSVLLALAVARASLRHAETLERRAERHYVEVELARGELQQLSARLLEIEEEGRRTLSRELHDEIGQTLALLQIEISSAQSLLPAHPQSARDRLRNARELAERTVNSVRDISLLLRPPLLDDLGLAPALHFQL